ncbi:hypothetical protein ABLV18_27445 [Klebsiella sp. CN_Kp114]|uniref:hypothetical protein n=1 Tax=unclassified Klebsiella TaxID=2608929 RepID=UPI0032B31647
MSIHINAILEGSRAAFQDGWLQDILKQPDAPFYTLSGLVGLINSSRASYGLEPLPSIEREDGAQAMPVELLYILPDYPNFRVISDEYDLNLVRSYIVNPLAVRPVTVRPIFVGGDLRLAVLDGCLRYIAMIMAREQGANVDFILARVLI